MVVFRLQQELNIGLRQYAMRELREWLEDMAYYWGNGNREWVLINATIVVAIIELLLLLPFVGWIIVAG